MTWRRRDGQSLSSCSSAASRQNRSWFFYLQRRHDIPCPLKPATERCSSCSCCRRPSLLITSTAKKRAARNPICLTGSVPNSSEWRDTEQTMCRSERGRLQDGAKEQRCNEQCTQPKAGTAERLPIIRLDGNIFPSCNISWIHFVLLPQN